MKKNLISFITGFLTCTILVLGAITVSAAAQGTSITALLNGSIRIMLNGKEFTMKDSSGAVLLPITANGRTYLPVRPLAEALNVPIEWEDSTKTVWIGGKTEVVTIDSEDQYEDYYGTVITKDADLLTSSAKTYKWGITNIKPQELARVGCYLIPEAKYKKFTATLYLDPEVKSELVFEVRKDTYDGKVLESYRLTPGGTIDIEVDITGISKIYLLSNVEMKHDKVNKLIIGEPVFKN